MAASRSATDRRPIRPLPPLLVNQIAAGEVVERPASVVKELVENALDAGSSRVRVELEAGGVELIRVVDDGGGIPPEELPLALAPHATSKLRGAEDLDRIGTLGFRGEALASIASVSRVEVRSRPPAAEAAALIEASGERVGEVRPASGAAGTSVTVRTLFFNTPARRKFLRGTSTEQQRCLDAVRDLAIGHPAVGFEAVCDGRAVLAYPAGQTPRQRALAVLGAELAPELLEVSADAYDDARGVALWGLVGRPSLARATAQAQHVLLNGRVIRDRTVQHALREAYRGLIEPGRHPTAVLMLEMDPGAVDVNVHPAKTEVRFRDQSMVHQVVLRSVRDALRAADLTPTVAQALGGPRVPTPEPREVLPPTPQTAPQGLSGFLDHFRRQAPATPEPGMDFGPAVTKPPPATPSSDPAPAAAAPSAALPIAAPRPAARVLQVHNSYLVTQDEQGVVIVDQHALHERVMFEALLERVRSAPLETQRMLVPVVVPVSASQAERLESLRPLLARIGAEVEAMGPAQVGVQAFPTFLFDRGVDPGEFVSDLLERAEAEGFDPGSEQAMHEVLDMMACKAAVKAGDRMSDLELSELVRLREAVERSSNCPHGRPTSVRLTIRELEKLFKRS